MNGWGEVVLRRGCRNLKKVVNNDSTSRPGPGSGGEIAIGAAGEAAGVGAGVAAGGTAVWAAGGVAVGAVGGATGVLA